MNQHHRCGGEIVGGALGIAPEHRHCTRCRAFGYDGVVPSGTNADANRTAWDAGATRSPEAMLVLSGPEFDTDQVCSAHDLLADNVGDDDVEFVVNGLLDGTIDMWVFYPTGMRVTVAPVGSAHG